MRKILLSHLFFVLFVTAVFAGSGDNAPGLVTDPAQAFVSGSIVVKGEGTAPPEAPFSPERKRMMALRAARVAALREAAGAVNGVTVSGETTVVNAAASSDVVTATVQGIVSGAQPISEAYDPATGVAVVYLSVPVTGAGGLAGRLLSQIAPMYPAGAPLFQPAGPYDGLIVDVRAAAFRPALINKVVTGEGEVVYDPASVAPEILVERGGAAYTNDIGKARALLGERGSKNPLVVRAASVVRSTDVEINPIEADSIISSDRSAGFLEEAKVVFVVR